MRAEVRGIESNDIRDWPDWKPAEPADEFQWFTVSIGAEGSLGADLFQVAIATPSSIKERRNKQEPFVGLVVERVEPQAVEDAIRKFVEAINGASWESVAEQLNARMSWEYGGNR